MGKTADKRPWLIVGPLLVGAIALTGLILAAILAAPETTGRKDRRASLRPVSGVSRIETAGGGDPQADPKQAAAAAVAAPGTEPLPPYGDKTLDHEEAIRGRILDRKGKPVADAVILAQYKETRDKPYRIVNASRVRSESDGSFVVGPLEHRSYSLFASKPETGVGLSAGKMPGAWVEIVLAPGAGVMGTVTARATGKPVAGAVVVVGDYSYSRETKTDANGKFLLAPLPPSVNTWSPPKVIVAAENFKLATRTNLLLHGGRREKVDFALDPGKTLAGKVTDSQTGKPVAGAVVGEGWEPYQRTVETGTDGSYKLPNVDISPNLYFTVRAEGYLPQQRQSDGSGSLDFELDASLVLTGKVWDPKEQPVAGARVYLHRIKYAPGFKPSSTNTAKKFTTTGADGVFHFEDVLPGQVAVIAFSRRYAPGEYGPVEVPLGGPVPDGIDVTLKNGVTVEGEVRDLQDNPLPSIRVQLQRGWGRIQGYKYAGNYIWSENPAYYTDAKGRFKLEGAIPGKLWLSAYDQTYGWTGTQIEGQEGQRITDVIISFAGSTITGVVLTADGEPVPGAWINARGPKNTPNQQWRWTSSDGLGRFKLGGIKDGDYDINVSTNYGQVPPRKDVPAGSRDLEFKLKSTQGLRGEVKSVITGRAVERFTINIMPQSGIGSVSRGRGTSWQQEMRSPDGTFERPVMPGIYTVTVKAPGHAPKVVRDIVVEERIAPQPLFFPLEGGGGIKGTAADAEGKPLRNVYVRANVYRAPGEPRRQIDNLLGGYDVADSKGRYFIEGLAPGNYLIQLNLGRRGSATAQVVVQGREMVTQDLRLVPTGRVVLHVVDEQGNPLAGVMFYFRDEATNRWLGWAQPSNTRGMTTSVPLPMGRAMVQAYHQKGKYVVDKFPVIVPSGKTVAVEVVMRKKE